MYCIEQNFDFGILSTINNTLELSTKEDKTNVQYSFKGKSNSNDIQTVEYGNVSGFIYIKYIKDGSGNTGNDSLQFKVRFE